jgi:hypothetical protein
MKMAQPFELMDGLKTCAPNSLSFLRAESALNGIADLIIVDID